MPNPTISGPVTATLVEQEWPSRIERAQAFYMPDGRMVQNGDIVSAELNTIACKAAPTDRGSMQISGPVLFAGMVRPQFGHVILSSLGRLWALDELPPDTRLLFIPKKSVNPAEYAHTRTVLKWLGFSGEFLLARKDTTFEELYTCPDIFGDRYGGRGLPGFYRWLDGRLPAAPDIDPDLKLYVTRSRLGPSAGRFACEDHLESLLKREGYQIVAPETISLAEQTRLFRSAGKLIFAEGSALHLFGLVRQPGQVSAIIQRRKELPPLIGAQLNDRFGDGSHVINAVKQLHWPPLRPDHLAVSVLDFQQLGEELAETGLIDRLDDWEVPDPQAETESLHAGLEEGQSMLTGRARRRFLRDLRAQRRKN